VVITPAFEALLEDSNTKSQAQAGDLVQECHSAAKLKTSLDPTAAELEKTMTQMVHCVEEKVARHLMQTTEQVAFQASVRRNMAEKLENYTCADPHHPTSTPVREEVWAGAADHAERHVQVMHDRPASKIHVVHDFIDAEECQAMEDAAEPILHRATVADGAGGSKYSENRKAMQAGIKVPWELEAAGNPIARLSRRVYDYTNHVLNLGIEEHGQEDLMSIQYFGRGYNDTAPDRYTPHCDGDCTGLVHKYGTRMATMVMYWCVQLQLQLQMRNTPVLCYGFSYIHCRVFALPHVQQNSIGRWSYQFQKLGSACVRLCLSLSFISSLFLTLNSLCTYQRLTAPSHSTPIICNPSIHPSTRENQQQQQQQQSHNNNKPVNPKWVMPFSFPTLTQSPKSWIPDSPSIVDVPFLKEKRKL
jgi:hypothetical protein